MPREPEGHPDHRRHPQHKVMPPGDRRDHERRHHRQSVTAQHSQAVAPHRTDRRQQQARQPRQPPHELECPVNHLAVHGHQQPGSLGGLILPTGLSLSVGLGLSPQHLGNLCGRLFDQQIVGPQSHAGGQPVAQPVGRIRQALVPFRGDLLAKVLGPHIVDLGQHIPLKVGQQVDIPLPAQQHPGQQQHKQECSPKQAQAGELQPRNEMHPAEPLHRQQKPERKHRQGGSQLDDHREHQQHTPPEPALARVLIQHQPQPGQQGIQQKHPHLPALQAVQQRPGGGRQPQPQEPRLGDWVFLLVAGLAHHVEQPPHLDVATPGQQHRDPEPRRRLPFGGQPGNRADQDREQRRVKILPPANVLHVGVVGVAPLAQGERRLRVDRHVGHVQLGMSRVDPRPVHHIDPAPDRQRKHQPQPDRPVFRQVAQGRESRRSTADLLPLGRPRLRSRPPPLGTFPILRHDLPVFRPLDRPTAASPRRPPSRPWPVR